MNGERIDGRKRLSDGDAVRVGETDLIFHIPGEGRRTETLPGASGRSAAELTPMQRRVLLVLARPCRDPGSFHPPASNQRIAAELVISVDAVKSHLRFLFAKFGVADLPQNEKRYALVGEALRAGALSPPELAGD